MLEVLVDGGLGIAIVPMSCAINPHPMKEYLMLKHTLKAVMSMPTDLFYPVGCVPCIMVWEAKKPHQSNPYYKTWFGYWKNDGFIKVKNKGRLDANRQWGETKENWLCSYFNREERAGVSVLAKVGHLDEWC